LNQAYNSFVLNKFSGDEVYSEIDEILNKLTPADLNSTFQKIKNKNYIDQLASEFGINSFEIFFSKVLESMRTSVRHALLHKNSTIGSNLFGVSLGDDIDFTYYNKSDIIKLLNNKFEESVEFHLPKRTLSDEVRLDNITQQSIDKLQDLVQTLKSDKTQTNPTYQKYVTTPPTLEEIAKKFTTQKIILPTVVESDRPPIIELPILKEPLEDPINVVIEPQLEPNIEKDRLRRLQEEMMYLNEGGRGTRFEVPYESPLNQPTPSINIGEEQINNNGVTLNKRLSKRLSNEEYTTSFRNNKVKK